MSASKINFAQGNQLPGTVRGVYQHLILTTPSSSTPSVGSYFVIDLKQKNIQVHKLSLLFNVTSNEAMRESNHQCQSDLVQQLKQYYNQLSINPGPLIRMLFIIQS